ncbi:catabolite gene activator protein [Synergistales bacterium]|nr:catabolite gene activator protein [Synergistales bacterium]
MWYFEETHLFQSLPLKDANDIIQKFVKRHIEFKKGAIIYGENDSNKHVYLVKSGSVCLTKFKRDGKQVIFSLLHKDTLFGGGDVLSERLYAHSAQANEKTKLCYVMKEDFIALLEKYDSLKTFILSTLYKQLRDAQDQIEIMSINDIKSRLVAVFSRFSKNMGTPIPDRLGCLYLKINMSQERLADYIGTTRESINRIMHELNDEGAIERVDGHSLILTKRFSDMADSLA